MASVPAAKGKQMSGSSAGRRKNNLPNRLEIPPNSLTPNSSAPSSLSPLIVPPSSSSSSSSATQRLTTELITAIGGRITPQPPDDDGDLFRDDDMINVPAPDGEDLMEINPANLKELVRLGEGAGGTVTKVENKVTGLIMAKKVMTLFR